MGDTSTGVSNARMDEIATELGVSFGKTKVASRWFGQQDGVYDKDGNHLGDIKSGSTLYTEEELKEKIGALLAAN